jgi:hypothetical protein
MRLRTVEVEQLIDEDHRARSLWELVGRLDLTLDHAQIAAVEGHAGREHTDPQWLISLWRYAYSRGRECRGQRQALDTPRICANHYQGPLARPLAEAKHHGLFMATS